MLFISICVLIMITTNVIWYVCGDVCIHFLTYTTKNPENKPINKKLIKYNNKNYMEQVDIEYEGICYM